MGEVCRLQRSSYIFCFEVILDSRKSPQCKASECLQSPPGASCGASGSAAAGPMVGTRTLLGSADHLHKCPVMGPSPCQGQGPYSHDLVLGAAGRGSGVWFLVVGTNLKPLGPGLSARSCRLLLLIRSDLGEDFGAGCGSFSSYAPAPNTGAFWAGDLVRPSGSCCLGFCCQQEPPWACG